MAGEGQGGIGAAGVVLSAAGRPLGRLWDSGKAAMARKERPCGW